MTPEKIKFELNNYLGKKIKIKYDLGRNKYEEYEGIIKELYNHIFIVELNENNNKLKKSFTYTDVITKTIKIKL